jgi:hypothetical protein
LAGICNLYHPQALLWGTTAQSVIATTRGVEDYFRAVFQISPPPTVEFEAHVARAFGAVVVLAGTYRLTLVSAGQPRSVPARFSFTLWCVAGQWRIAEHHSSLLPSGPLAAS